MKDMQTTDYIMKHINKETILNKGEKSMGNKQVYLAGDLLKKGSIMLRNAEAEELRNNGVRIYSPIEDKSINDKSNQTEESNNGLAERIVKNDTTAIIKSDFIVIEPQDDAKGTMVELGQLKGMKDASRMISELLIKHKDTIKYILNTHEDVSCIIEDFEKLARKLDKKVYPHYEDIRRMYLPEVADRRSWSVNQYVYGVCLDLTNGKGFYEWNDIVDELHGEFELDWHKEYVHMMRKALEESKDRVDRDEVFTRTHVIVGVKEIMDKYDLDHEEMYEEIYRLNRLHFKGLTFISNHLKENNKVEIGYKSESKFEM